LLPVRIPDVGVHLSAVTGSVTRAHLLVLCVLFLLVWCSRFFQQIAEGELDVKVKMW